MLALESDLGVNGEQAINAFAARHDTLGLILSDYYDVAHFGVALTVLIAVWIWRPDRYRRLRRALVITNLMGFAVFWLWPMAPPRLLPPFVDVVGLSHAIGSWHSGTLAATADQYASMPSLHLSWAIWVTIAVWTCTTRLVWRVAAALHPCFTLIAVIATGNHLFADAAAGVVVAGLALLLSDWCARLARPLRRPRWSLSRRPDEWPLG